MSVLDTRGHKLVGDLVDARADLALAVLGIALASAIGLVWQPAARFAEISVLPLGLLVVVQGAKQIASARAAERPVLRALGAAEGFSSRLGALEGACFGGVAAVVGLLLSLSAMYLAGTLPATSAGWTGLWLVAATLAGALSASITLSRADA